MKELLSENKKLTKLNQEKSLKGTREKVVSILGSLTRLWSIMEAEQEILPGDSHKAVSEHIKIAGSLEQKILFIGQVFNSISRQRRLLNVLNTLIDNGTKVKEITKKHSLDLSNAENPY